jgi:hypothetical protein
MAGTSSRAEESKIEDKTSAAADGTQVFLGRISHAKLTGQPDVVVKANQYRMAAAANYRNCQKYVPLDSANLSKVIASEAKQSLRLSKRLLRRKAPRNDRLSEQIFDGRYS